MCLKTEAQCHVNKLYVDGCSFVYGEGLSRDYALGNLLHADLDLSSPGKSNIAMCEDLYNHINQYDTFIIGFTFSSRYSFCNKLFERKNLCVGVLAPNLGSEKDEKDYEILRDLYIKFSDPDVLDLRTDFYIDSVINLLESHNKKYVLFSWEHRKMKQHKKKVLYIGSMFTIEEKLSDGHLNELGMKKLVKILTKNQ